MRGKKIESDLISNQFTRHFSPYRYAGNGTETMIQIQDPSKIPIQDLRVAYLNPQKSPAILLYGTVVKQ